MNKEITSKIYSQIWRVISRMVTTYSSMGWMARPVVGAAAAAASTSPIGKPRW